MSFFDSLECLPEDPIFGIQTSFAKDPRPHKVNLGIGSYKDAEGKAYILNCVREAEKALLSKNLSKDYLSIEGDQDFLKLTETLIYGDSLLNSSSGKIFLVQSIGGTGALFLGAQLLSLLTKEAIYLPNKTWPNHPFIFSRSGLKMNSYHYYHEKSHEIDFERICHEISKMKPRSVILLHTCCQNPTGMDLTNDQWIELSSRLKKQQVIPFFDFAYQGFKTSVEDDAFPLRYFVSQGHEMLVAQSCAKNFGLYGERVGTLSVVTQVKNSEKLIESQLKRIIRSNYSNPPRHGAEIVTHILSSEPLKKAWLTELNDMRDRLKEMRHTLASGLQAKGIHRDWSFLNRQNGFFSFCGLNQSEVHRLIKDYAIYMPANGRINVGGLNGHNMDYVIDAILDVTH